jgi:hypothetical protein
MRPLATLPHRPKTQTGACWCGPSSDVRQVLRSQDVGVTWIEGEAGRTGPAQQVRPIYPGALHPASLLPVGSQRFELVPMAGDAPHPASILRCLDHPDLSAAQGHRVSRVGYMITRSRTRRTPSARRIGPSPPWLLGPARPDRSSSSPLRECTATQDHRLERLMCLPEHRQSECHEPRVPLAGVHSHQPRRQRWSLVAQVRAPTCAIDRGRHRRSASS